MGRHPVSRTEGPAAAPATNARQWDDLVEHAGSAIPCLAASYVGSAAHAHRCLPKSAAIPSSTAT